MSKAVDVSAAVAHLSGDPVLGREVRRQPAPVLEKSENAFQSLCKAIIFQQLSGKAATTIYNRFVALFPEGDFPNPADVLTRSAEELRTAGVSAQKSGYLHDLSAKFEDGTVRWSELDSLPDDEIKRELRLVKGLGEWSADMFLMFSLCRMDVWPTGDLGIANGCKLLMGLDDKPKKDVLVEIAEPWAPYRTVAACYVWGALDTIVPD